MKFVPAMALGIAIILWVLWIGPEKIFARKMCDDCGESIGSNRGCPECAEFNDSNAI